MSNLLDMIYDMETSPLEESPLEHFFEHKKEEDKNNSKVQNTSVITQDIPKLYTKFSKYKFLNEADFLKFSPEFENEIDNYDSIKVHLPSLLKLLNIFVNSLFLLCTNAQQKTIFVICLLNILKVIEKNGDLDLKANIIQIMRNNINSFCLGKELLKNKYINGINCISLWWKDLGIHNPLTLVFLKPEIVFDIIMKINMKYSFFQDRVIIANLDLSELVNCNYINNDLKIEIIRHKLYKNDIPVQLFTDLLCANLNNEKFLSALEILTVRGKNYRGLNMLEKMLENSFESTKSKLICKKLIKNALRTVQECVLQGQIGSKRKNM